MEGCLSLCGRMLFPMMWQVVVCHNVAGCCDFVEGCLSLCGRMLFPMMWQVVVCHNVAGCCLS